MKKNLCKLLLFIFCTLESGFANLEKDLQQIDLHCILEDYEAARKVVVNALEEKNSPLLWERLISALAHLGREKEMIETWKNYQRLYPTLPLKDHILEEMSWEILKKGACSSALAIREITLLAAYLSQDAKGIKILYQGLKEDNETLRALAVELCAQCKDAVLKDEVKKLFQQEQCWKVRKAVLLAIGAMGIQELQEDLEKSIASPTSSLKEKEIAIKAFILLLDNLERNKLEWLLKQNSYGLRLLAVQSIRHFLSDKDLDLLFISTRDAYAEVRAAAFQAIAFLRPPFSTQLIAYAYEGVKDQNFKVALSAITLLTLFSPQEGHALFIPYLQHIRSNVRRLAASAVRWTGPYGIDLACRFYRTHQDSYVRLNLALGLIEQRVETLEAAQVIRNILKEKAEKFFNCTEGLFNAILPMIQNEEKENVREVDQLIQLELLSVVALVSPQDAQELIKDFLREKKWGISTVAITLLLTEGNELALSWIENLLQDSHPSIKIQAALILALWGRDPKVISILEEHYFSSSFDVKLKILEGISRIGSKQSLSFLLRVLEEPNQSLRIVAAMAILQCLNHQ